MVAASSFDELFAGEAAPMVRLAISLVDSPERAEEIDVSRAEAARQRAQEAIAQRGGDIDLAKAELALRRAAIRLQVGQRRRANRRGAGLGTGADNEL